MKYWFLSFFSCILLVSWLTTTIGQAQVRSSNNFQIQSDSINFGGGFSSSTNFQQESTFGEIATGFSSSTNFQIRAGYQQMQQPFLSLSIPADVVMSPTIGGVSGGIANGSTSVVALTDNGAGYRLQIAALNTPAMQKGVDSIADYAPSGAAPDFSFITGPVDAQFGFSPSGPDIIDRFKDNGAACDVGSNITALNCWDGLSTTDTTIAESNGANQPAGATTTLYFRVGIGGSVVQAPGQYTATTTLTLLAL